jgi:hypothetical protein
MRKRILSGVLLACIIVPTFFWAADLIKVSVNPDSIAATIYDSSYLTFKAIVDRAANHLRTEIDTEYEKITEDIENLENFLKDFSSRASANSPQMVALRNELDDLLRRRKAILKEREKQLFAMNQKRLDAEKYFLVKLRAKSQKEEWNSTWRVAELEKSLGEHSNRSDQEKAAAVVNDFIDAVVSLDVEQVKKLSSTTLRSEIGLSRVRNMRRSAPQELETGFELREAGDKRLEVWAGEKIALLCSSDGAWVFQDAWK